MAIITLDQTNVNFTKFIPTLITDKQVIKISNIEQAVYGSGNSKYKFSTTISAKDEGSFNYLNGLIMGIFYYGNDTLKFSMPKEFTNQSTGSKTYSTGSLSSGASTLVVSQSASYITDNDFERGNYFNIAGSDKLYTIINYNTATKTVGFYPRLDKALSNKAINVYTPTANCIITNTNIKMTSTQGTKFYRKTDIELVEAN